MTIANRRVMEALAAGTDDSSTLALVLETEGSTYVRAGAMALFGGERGQVGWLSGGCLEGEIGRRAAEAVASGTIGWLEIDTREDEDLFAGSAIGCRGRLRIALLPLHRLPGWPSLVRRWLDGDLTLEIALQTDGAHDLQLGADSAQGRLDGEDPRWGGSTQHWSLRYPPLSRVALFGAGPETAWLLPTLQGLGWRTILVERRARWAAQAALADVALDLSPAEALAHGALAGLRAALVMHHNFELDRETLECLAAGATPFVGLLGPIRRRDDLFHVLPAAAHAALATRLRSPVGLDLGGQGAEAIALSIAAQLQQFRHGG